jgi:hypothetical protein
MFSISRRGFIKTVVGTGAVITAFPQILLRKAQAAWSRGTVVHPNVDNLRVVGLTDAKMMKPDASIARLDEFIVEEVVGENLDKLACVLTQTRNPKEAWRTIFIKPPRKSWSEVVVAIKTNSQGNTPSAVISKICHSLINTLGVKSSNIHIYDAGHGMVMEFTGLPEGCQVEKSWGGVTTDTEIPQPWSETINKGKSTCLKHLVNGSVDILINIATCKKHSFYWLGGFSMTMKNHFGSFLPRWGHASDNGLDYLISINQTPEILGPIDNRTGRVLYPRQQLCIIDAFRPMVIRGRPIKDPTNFLAMGVLSPIVDYQVATKFIAERIGWKVNMKAVNRMLTDFGLTESDLPAGGKLIEV